MLLNIAFISYEYPPDTAVGGIATYVEQAARMLTQRGHHIEVFTASSHREGTEIENGITTHRIIIQDRAEFPDRIGTIFAQRHQVVQFDVLEAPEINAEAQGAINLVSDLPWVVKLHTPSFLIRQLSETPPDWRMKIRRFVGALRRGQRPQPFLQWQYVPEQDSERLYALQADEIAAPSTAIAASLIHHWELDPIRVSCFPLPYVPSTQLLNIPLGSPSKVVTFIGRLELRKGVLDLAQAIPQILQQHPDTIFRFVGAAWCSPNPKLNMQQYLQLKLKRYHDRLDFVGHVTADRLSEVLSSTAICVFPSLWESFGLVCLEAMAAGRCVVGSSSGGMSEILADGYAGVLVPPRSPNRIAASVIELLNQPERQIELGQKARDRVLETYNLDRIGTLQEESYARAIAARRKLVDLPYSNHSIV